MASFDSGVSSYVHGRAIVDVYFPVDARGTASICCAQCFYFSEASKRCLLNNEKPSYPGKYVGYLCPLKSDDDFFSIINDIINRKEENNESH